MISCRLQGTKGLNRTIPRPVPISLGRDIANTWNSENIGIILQDIIHICIWLQQLGDFD